MKKVKAWLSAARLRTLPLSVSGIIVGTAIANYKGFQDNLLFTLCLLTTIAFQILSNFANDYGDGVKGTDNEERLGPARALQSGLLTDKELKKGIITTAIISLVLAVSLILCAFNLNELLFVLLFLFLGMASVWAAIKYTVGDNAYGYRGMGDVFVFLFFGLLAVLGTIFLYEKGIDWAAVLPAITIGFLCVGVLNLNNLRDVNSDTNSGKQTLVVKMGYRNGKIYHSLLVFISLVCLLIYWYLSLNSVAILWIFIPYIVIGLHLSKVWRTAAPKDLDPELKKLALSTFSLAMLIYFAMNYFL
ncbi:1,4-dihydroxy-2-naphthoate octaprenyltransferase [Flavobacterium sp. ASW18X]|uniref:1,4-dihydroxy-2-naphthoate octaprenyltransferase n=1 Tax=Flavobacterium sp. ASW18X TaxID=2572595 RepID=UPI0010AE0AD1|nr:1,4-dihydroxy-2-naphthoate octaprenyltransferase [Flavobacterium sp. ASW18X]TKD66220.1 1,4-dihydroxy-2-naphthoate octaprenyltransferase [Flavobacterium sp. ASW18X]